MLDYEVYDAAYAMFEERYCPELAEEMDTVEEIEQDRGSLADNLELEEILYLQDLFGGDLPEYLDNRLQELEILLGKGTELPF